mmetsp:Transcript_14647/g.28855  ORF Transcript_14647/g.28855 Transcript_14647/m.28855 type:complete len:137 (-) Transcript_14647:196-606(-)
MPQDVHQTAAIQGDVTQKNMASTDLNDESSVDTVFSTDLNDESSMDTAFPQARWRRGGRAGRRMKLKQARAAARVCNNGGLSFNADATGMLAGGPCESSPSYIRINFVEPTDVITCVNYVLTAPPTSEEVPATRLA